jgi:hypothetical protein
MLLKQPAAGGEFCFAEFFFINPVDASGKISYNFGKEIYQNYLAASRKQFSAGKLMEWDRG